MFYVTTMLCRYCNVRTVGQRVICLECLPNADIGAFLLDRAKTATAMYYDFVDVLSEEQRARWDALQTFAATIEELPRLQQTSAAIQFRKRLDMTAETNDTFGMCTAMYIRYREYNEDVELFAQMLWYTDYERAKAFDELRKS